MKNVIKTIKTLELVWPDYMTAVTVCRALDRLGDDVVQYWEPFWDGENDELGIRFASETDVVEALPGDVVHFEGGFAVNKEPRPTKKYDLTTRIDEKKRTVAYVYDSGDLKDLRALSETGRRVELKEGRVRVGFCDVPVDVTNSFVVEKVGDENLTWFHKDSNENTTIEDVARHYERKLD